MLALDAATVSRLNRPVGMQEHVPKRETALPGRSAADLEAHITKPTIT